MQREREHSQELTRPLTVEMVRTAMNLVVYDKPNKFEPLRRPCDYPRVCGEDGCRFPSYLRAGQPADLTASILVQLGYPLGLLKDLDREYEISEVLHPGVKLRNSRNAALRRLDEKGMALLAFLQDRRHRGRTWTSITLDATRRNWLKPLDRRRRPWLY